MVKEFWMNDSPEILCIQGMSLTGLCTREIYMHGLHLLLVLGLTREEISKMNTSMPGTWEDTTLIDTVIPFMNLAGPVIMILIDMKGEGVEIVTVEGHMIGIMDGVILITTE